MTKKLKITPPPHIPNFIGPFEESIFSYPLWWCLDEEKKKDISSQNLETLIHIIPLQDDRLLLLTGALIIENSIDNYLSDFMPGYNTLKDNRDFSLSMKIGLAKALALCPSKIFNYCNLIRLMRNEFAHNLQTKKIEQLADKHKQTLFQYLVEIYPTYDINKSLFKQAFDLISETVFALEIYRSNIQKLNKMIRSDNIELIMEEFFKPLSMSDLSKDQS